MKKAAQVYLALGSNLNDPANQLQRALKTLEALSDKPLVHSDFYRSKPLGPGEQADYINAVALIYTTLTPEALLQCLQKIEDQHKRNRNVQRWGPRTLDLDILLYDQIIMDTPDLTIPHKEMLNRNFVLYPLYDIAPELILPDQSGIKSRLDKLDKTGLYKANIFK